MRKRMAVAVLAVLALLGLLLTASSVVASPPGQGPGIEGEVISAAVVGSEINYQGRLTDPDGNPLSGTYNLGFQLWNAESGGTQLGSTITVPNVDVENGLFNVEIPVTQSWFNGRALWLRVQVGAEWLGPRQEILPVPYALSLRPGAIIDGDVQLTGNLTTGDLTWDPPKTGYLSVPPAAFVPFQNGYTFALWAWLQNNGATLQGWSAPVQLPQGATVTKVTLYVYDLSFPSDLGVALGRAELADGSVDAMAAVTVAVNTGFGSDYDDSIDNAVIDNSKYVYQLGVSFPGGAAANLRLYGVVIEYTYTGPY